MSAEAFDAVVARIRALPPKERHSAKDAARALVSADRQRSACDRSVFDAIMARINWTSGIAFPGFNSLQADTGFCRRAVAGSVARLRAANLLLVDPRTPKDGRTSNSYTIPGIAGVSRTALVQMIALPLVQPLHPP